MRKAKYVWSGINNTIDDITFGKIYDVVKYIRSKHHGQNSDMIKIICDDGIKRTYFLRSGKENYFIDATIELRNEVINDILT